MNQESIKTTIYIGLNDSETMSQSFLLDKYVTILKNVCKSYHVNFSYQFARGGFFQGDGELTEENTVTLILVDVPEETINEIAKDLCVFFNQETVMITREPCSVVYVKEKL